MIKGPGMACDLQQLSEMTPACSFEHTHRQECNRSACTCYLCACQILHEGNGSGICDPCRGISLFTAPAFVAKCIEQLLISSCYVRSVEKTTCIDSGIWVVVNVQL